MPMSGSEKGPVQLSSDGKTISMPIETFRAREGDLLRLEALTELLKKQLEEERELTARLSNQIKEMEAVLSDERLAVKQDIAKTKRTYGLLGFVLGGVAVGVAK